MPIGTVIKDAHPNCPRYHRLSGGQAEVVKSLYVSGLSLARIAAETGIPHETARLILHRAGIRMRHVHPVLGVPIKYLDTDAAMLLGVHCGDGWISDRWGIALHSADAQMIRIVFELARRVLSVEPFITGRGTTTTVRSGKRQVLDFFIKFGFTRGPKAGKVAVPAQIFEAELEVVRAFLKGLFSSDGCFSYRHKSARCVLQVSSIALRDGFVRLASRSGFRFRSYDYIKSTGHNKLPIHVAYLGKRESVMRWMTEVGSICDAHLARHARWRKEIAM